MMTKIKERKTIPIDALLEYANGYLAADYPDGDSAASVARRTGLIDLLEQALVTANRYRGFSYLDEKAITKSKPGVRWTRDKDEWLVDTDPTRRRYA
jgi:hypothetical protein